MARVSWIDDDNHPDLDAHVSQLEHFALLAEVAAYTVMQMMHDMAQAKVQRAVK
jgi:hypothetical protein